MKREGQKIRKSINKQKPNCVIQTAFSVEMDIIRLAGLVSSGFSDSSSSVFSVCLVQHQTYQSHPK